ncbi:unnamed protein product [Prorocentrum cordatum]|uniref:Uncharacterized protein n=1 Tax=Prorocentrum cordatum TaxID=2364126 RepID=A0ABN9SLR3_9DINO|nr:unnamed protein product [Polarella glacialis]
MPYSWWGSEPPRLPARRAARSGRSLDSMLGPACFNYSMERLCLRFCWPQASDFTFQLRVGMVSYTSCRCTVSLGFFLLGRIFIITTISDLIMRIATMSTWPCKNRQYAVLPARPRYYV